LLEGLDIPLTNAELELVITGLLSINNSTAPEAEINTLIECILEAGIIVEARA